MDSARTDKCPAQAWSDTSSCSSCSSRLCSGLTAGRSRRRTSLRNVNRADGDARGTRWSQGARGRATESREARWAWRARARALEGGEEEGARQMHMGAAQGESAQTANGRTASAARNLNLNLNQQLISKQSSTQTTKFKTLLGVHGAGFEGEASLKWGRM